MKFGTITTLHSLSAPKLNMSIVYNNVVGVTSVLIWWKSGRGFRSVPKVRFRQIGADEEIRPATGCVKNKGGALFLAFPVAAAGEYKSDQLPPNSLLKSVLAVRCSVPEGATIGKIIASADEL